MEPPHAMDLADYTLYGPLGAPYGPKDWPS